MIHDIQNCNVDTMFALSRQQPIIELTKCKKDSKPRNFLTSLSIDNIGKHSKIK